MSRPEHDLLLVVDVEIAALDDAACYVEPISAPSNYRNADTIARYIEEKTADQIEKAALDPDLNRLVAVGRFQHATEKLDDGSDVTC